MTRREIGWLIACLVAFALLACLPLLRHGYLLSLGVSVAMYTVLATSWALFSGPTHYISLATAAFYGIGAYVVAGGIGRFVRGIRELAAPEAAALRLASARFFDAPSSSHEAATAASAKTANAAAARRRLKLRALKLSGNFRRMTLRSSLTGKS